MNVSNLILLIFLFTALGVLVQRTERKRRLLTAGIILIPFGWFIYRWAIFRGQLLETFMAAGIGLTLNILFWLFYSRLHPPGSSDDIRVIGMED